jgi:hypothetical protein
MMQQAIQHEHASICPRAKAVTVIAFALIISMFVTSIDAAESTLSQTVIDRFGSPPDVPQGELSEDLQAAVNTVFSDDLGDANWSDLKTDALETIAMSNDPRLAWLVSDLMRFAGQNALQDLLASVASKLLGITFSDQRYWGETTDHLIAWDIPAPPDYLRSKRNVFTALVPGWEDIFVEGDIDWRHVSWGGVLIDSRPYDTTDEPCNCIPAADNPKTTSAAEATWLDDDAIVFGVEVNGEYRAYPRRIMEVREMVNDTLGGRDLGIPYCTLCGAAQAYFTDELPEGVERPVLRTSGLLFRSNKVMYDVVTHSVFDTFKGHAVTGELAEKQVQLKQASVLTTDWGTWKNKHPKTTVLAEELALGRDFDFRNNRDANGPIFPVGDVDPRLSVHEEIVGVVSGNGTPVAFQLSKAMIELTRGNKIQLDDIYLTLDAGGIRAVNANGNDMGSHQAFWFAWSQFYPDTKLWPES